MSALSRPKTSWGPPRFVRLITPMTEYGLRTGDYIAVVPVDRFRCDSVYVLDVLGRPIPYICQSNLRGGIAVTGFGEGATTATHTPEQFEDLLLGQVVATRKVIDPSLFEAQSGCRLVPTPVRYARSQAAQGDAIYFDRSQEPQITAKYSKNLVAQPQSPSQNCDDEVKEG